jgi:hypothetical protein
MKSLLALKSLITITQARIWAASENFEDTPKLLTNAIRQLAMPTNVYKPATTSQAIEKWKSLNGRQVTNNDFTKKEIIDLCWTQEIVLQENFHAFISSTQTALPRKAIQGLLFCLFSEFQQLNSNRNFRSFLESQIRKSSHSSPFLSKVVENLSMLLGEQAIQSSAKKHCESLSYPIEFLEKFGIPESSRYSELLYFRILELLIESTVPKSEKDIFLFSVIAPGVLKQQVYAAKALSILILSERTGNDEQFTCEILKLALTDENIGDPRIYPKNWVQVSKEATDKFTSLLSKEDLELFFKVLYKSKVDVHKRKRFWLRYMKVVKKSRVFISRDDNARYHQELSKQKADGRNFGLLDNSGSTASSIFVMDFGKVIAVEFKEESNALYLYSPEDYKEIMPNFFSQTTKFSTLKNKGKALETFSHNIGWQSKVDNYLSIRRIFPDAF